ncbi:MAG: acyl-CoA oxidase [Frankiaceae bacterium]|nr:acyl-CoA oxidase [Frankiaceae bacterium]
MTATVPDADSDSGTADRHAAVPDGEPSVDRVEAGALQHFLEGDEQRDSTSARRRTRESMLGLGYRYGLPRDEYRDQVFDWLGEIGRSGMGSLGFPAEFGGEDDPAAAIASFETLAHGDLSLLVKVGVQFGLTGGAIHRLGTRRHHEQYLPKIAGVELPGCFAMTEVGHGSDVRSLRTTATYDPATDELVIDTPDEAARKDYIGNAARHGQIAVVFAQLISGAGESGDGEGGDTENHGVHAVIVPIRDAQGTVAEGVEVTDDGEKMGLNGVDNGQLSFHSVRVPRENLLDRFGTIDENGEYSSSIEKASARFFTMLGALVQGRVSVACGALSVAKSAQTIAVRYAEQRRQFQSTEGRETLLMDYLTHQRRLLPGIATSYALHSSLRRLRAAYVKSTTAEPGSSDVREVEGLAAGLKAYTTWHTTRTVQTCREACGGEGYLAVNRLPALKSDSDVFTTFEGDNTVLLQLLVKGLLSNYKEQFEDLDLLDIVRYGLGRASDTLLESVPFVNRGMDRDESTLRSRKTYLASFRWREDHLTSTLARRFKGRVDDGADPLDALIECQDHVLLLGNAHLERLLLEQFAEDVDACEDPAAAEVLDRLWQLFAVERTWSDRGWFLEHGHFSAATAKALGSLLNALCRELRPDALALVEGFGIPDEILAAPIAVGDGR